MRYLRLACIALLFLPACDDESSPPTADARKDGAIDGSSSKENTAPVEASADKTVLTDVAIKAEGLAPDQGPIADGKPATDLSTVDSKPIEGSPAGCGNTVLETGEECDDGNKLNLDGCDSKCKFEQDHRINNLLIYSSTDTTCAKNAFGGAVSSTALAMIQPAINTAVQDGSITIMFKALNLDDLSGTNDTSMSLGILTGTPATGTGYDGNSDLDWWYTVDSLGIDSLRNPLAQLSGAIASKALKAGPGKISMTLDLMGTTATFALSSTIVSATTGASSIPKTSSGTTPGHLASEHLKSTLTSFGTMGSAAAPGKLCGNASAQSLAAISLPSAITTYCSGYSSSNSFLDLIVGGCTVLFFPVIVATQPDTEDPSVAAAGAGPPYKLVANSSTKIVTSCQDKGGATVTLANCLADAAYSMYFQFTTDRVIIK